MNKILAIILTVSFLFSHNYHHESVGDFDKHQIYKEIKIENINPLLVNRLKFLNLDLDHVHMENDNSVKFVVSEYDLEKLDLNNLDYVIIHDDLESFYRSRLTNDMESRDFEYGSMGGYYTFNEIVENLDELYEDYPNLVAQKISIGETLEGRQIWAIKMSDNPNIDEDEPEVLYTGLHHSREPMSYMNLFYYMNWLVENYETDPMAKNILDQRELWFVPALNPDGLIYNQQVSPNGGALQRKNRKETCNGGVDGVDLNRNYGYAWNCQGNFLGGQCETSGSSGDGCDETYRGTFAFSEPETQAMKNFVEEHNFPVAFNYHSYSNLLLYPFGYTYNNPMNQDDLNTFDQIGQELVSENGYYLGTGVDILYPVNGEACDWMYGTHGIFAYTPEVGSSSDGFWPATSRIIPLCEENLYANQYLALVAGPSYSSSAYVLEENFLQGNSYSMYLAVNNFGLSDSAGDVYIDIVSSDNIIFDETQIILNGFESGQSIDFGEINFDISNSALEGSIEEIIINVYDENNESTSNSISLLIGDPDIFVFQDFENIDNWIVGDTNDTATAGIWERAVPNPTYDDNGVIIQPDFDHTPTGQFCYVTGNNVSNNSSEFGFGDVDGGKTTLITPNYNLSDYSTAVISYWRWFVNNAAGGANPGNDVWRVDMSNDGGLSWTSLELTDQNSNQWTRHQFILNNDDVELTNLMRFRFIAEDISYPGDNGSGGSIIEAALDDFKILVFDDALIGDANYDGNLNVLDVVIVVSMILGNQESDLIVDINGDGGLNIQDIILLMNIILSGE
tara:strand:+ start:405 stop:2780 length:2376 start_codon:yes stop_codon:yes gene_type:complete